MFLTVSDIDAPKVDRELEPYMEAPHYIMPWRNNYMLRPLADDDCIAGELIRILKYRI